MGLEQMSAISPGSRYKRPYVDEINARTPYLPMLYQQKKQDEYRDKMYSLDEEKLAQDREFGLKNLDMQRDIQEEAKKRNKLARNLGYANIGLGAGLGVLNNWDTIKQGATSLFPSLGESGVVDFDWSDAFTSAPQASVSPDLSSVAASPIEWVSESATDYIIDPLKQAGSWAWDTGKGLFDDIVGNSIDIDWDWSDAF